MAAVRVFYMNVSCVHYWNEEIYKYARMHVLCACEYVRLYEYLFGSCDKRDRTVVPIFYYMKRVSLIRLDFISNCVIRRTHAIVEFWMHMSWKAKNVHWNGFACRISICKKYI